jgi:hypothetical protein
MLTLSHRLTASKMLISFQKRSKGNDRLPAIWLKLAFGFAELAFGSVPAPFSLVHFFWTNKRNEHIDKKNYL